MNPINNSHNHVVETIKRKFYKCSLDFESEGAEVSKLSWNQQEEILNDTVNNPLAKRYPMKRDFIRFFIKKLISFFNEDQEIHDDLYKHLCMTMNEDDKFYYRHYVIGNNLADRIIIRETNNLVVNGTTGMKTWEASLMFVDWALCNKEVFRSKHVLELGSGVGFAGITLAKYCQPNTVVMSDCHSDVLHSAEDNIHINFSDLQHQSISSVKMYTNIKVNIGAVYLDWMDLSSIPSELCPDVIIGADIVYDPAILEPLLNTLQLFLKKKSTAQIFIAGVVRNKGTFDTFLKKIEAVNLRVENIKHEQNVFIEWDRLQEMYIIKIKL